MKLTDQLTEYVNAAFSGIWIQTVEPTEAEREVGHAAKANNWRIAFWDIDRGLRGIKMPDSGDPLAAVHALPKMANGDQSTLLVMHNLHRLLNNPALVQAVINQLVDGKAQQAFIVVLAPMVAMPPELEKLFVVIEHDLPDKDDLAAIARSIHQPEELEKAKVLQGIEQSAQAAAGLTRYEAEGAFSLSLARHNQLKPDVVWDLKAQSLRKSGALSLYRGREKLCDLGGLTSLKQFCSAVLAPKETAAKPRGVLLLGVPGTGKSAFAKALGNETGRPTLSMDMGAMYGSLVGQTEANVRQALKIADAMAPCILFVDELEKALSGVGGQGDSGVSTRLFGTLLTWLSDHTSDVFFVGTCNNISMLPPEFSRAERFDGLFFMDLPTSADKDLIWAMYRTQYAIDDEQERPNDTDWTGCEIKHCCRMASLLGITLSQASLNVVPVARTAAESVDNLKRWASGRCLCANSPGVYGGVKQESVIKSAVRKINRASSN